MSTPLEKKKALLDAIHDKLNSLLGRDVVLVSLWQGDATRFQTGKLSVMYLTNRPKRYILDPSPNPLDSFYALQLISIVEVRDHVIITIKAYHP